MTELILLILVIVGYFILVPAVKGYWLRQKEKEKEKEYLKQAMELDIKEPILSSKKNSVISFKIQHPKNNNPKDDYMGSLRDNLDIAIKKMKEEK